MIRAALLSLLGLAGLGLIGACSGEANEGGGECSVDADCTGGDSCTLFTCTDGSCTKQFAPVGTPVYAGYVAGDCTRRQCGPGGTIQPAVDKLDVPVNFLNPCSQGTCTDSGMQGTAVKGDGVQCGATSAVVCMAGVCSGCTTDQDCLGPTSVCATATCTMGTCTYAAKMDAVASNVDVGDCFVARCDMTGSIRVEPLPDLTVCGESTTCSPRGCSSGVCVALPLPGPEVTDPADVAGNCKKVACNGMGEFVETADAMDYPPDDAAGDCKVPACEGTTVTSTFELAGTPCMGGTTNMCNEAGICN